MDPIYALGRILDPIFALGRILDPIFALGRILDPISPPCSTVTMVNVQIDFYYVISARLYNNEFCQPDKGAIDYSVLMSHSHVQNTGHQISNAI